MLKHCFLFILLQLSFYTMIYCQAKKSLFISYINKEIPQNKYGEILVSKDGKVLVSTSEFSFAIITGGNMGGFTIGLDNQDYGIKNLKSVFTGAPVKTLTESTDRNIFFSTAENQVTYFNNTEPYKCDIPPFYFPIKGDSPKEITKLWFDKENSLYIGVTDGAFYIVPKAGTNQSLDPGNYKIGRTKDSDMVILKGELPVKKIMVGQGVGVYSFAENSINKNIVWLGTDNGLYNYNKITESVNKVLTPGGKITITHIETLSNGDTWFSTLEKGMGVYHQPAKNNEFYADPIKQAGVNISYPILDFCIKSTNDFFVAVKDSLPAIFNTIYGSYKFIDDPSFVLSKNNTTDIKLDSTGNFYFIKGGLLYSANLSDKPEWIGNDSANPTHAALIYGITDFNSREITNYLTKPELLKKLKLKYNENSIIIYITSNYSSQNKKTQFAWRLDGDINNWVEMPVYNADNDSSNRVELPDIKPGKYNFRVRVKVAGGMWSTSEAQMEIIITPPYWVTWWFWTTIIVALSLLVYSIIQLRVSAVRRAEKLKARYEKELMELEAKALRAQMNPHFVFNCLNSIKALMQEEETEKGVKYLTTFSKLIRTLFNNADKKNISLYDEIETCKFYLQLEAMRFDSKFSYTVNVDENIDLKSVHIPALIIQPFIENAIWHGIVPRDTGGNVWLNVTREGGNIEIIVEDDGIGRESSQQNKSASNLTHQSKGVNLTQSRLDLDNLLQKRQAKMETIDKRDEAGKAAGTKVIITINEETS
ncbi:MAG: histidine kinase [Ferruginibacter sp.]